MDKLQELLSSEAQSKEQKRRLVKATLDQMNCELERLERESPKGKARLTVEDYSTVLESVYTYQCGTNPARIAFELNDTGTSNLRRRDPGTKLALELARLMCAGK